MTTYKVTRDVAANEPNNFTGRDVKAGELFTEHDGPHYGSVDYRTGVALDIDGTFIEFPANAVKVIS
jgi:hypothetical protein